MKELNLNSNVLKLKQNTIQIKVPASVTYDLKKMNSIKESVLDRLGCPNCHSGHDLRFDIERQFVFNENLEFLNQF